MPFDSNDRIFFKKNGESIDRPWLVSLLSAILLIGVPVYVFDAEQGERYNSGHENTISRFAFAPQDIELELSSFEEDEEPFLSRVSTEVPMTGSLPNASTDDPPIVSTIKNEPTDDAAPAHVHSLGPSKSPPSPYAAETKKPASVGKADNVPEDEPKTAVAALSVEEPPKITPEPTVKIQPAIRQARTNRKRARSRRASGRSRRLRARARRRSNNAGQPLFKKLPAWAHTALFQSGS